jgi:acyl-CoA thioester hydrolase
MRLDVADFLRQGFRFFTPTPTRWGDCDMLGHINNVEYLRYYESGRLDYFHRVLDIETGGEPRDSLILADIQATFLRQIHHPTALEVGTRVSRLGDSSFTIDCAIFAPGEDEPRSLSRAISVWFDYQSDRSKPIPDAIRRSIEKFEGIEA